MAKNIGNELINILNQEKQSYLSKVAFGSRKEILKNFDNEKDVDEKPFAKLEKATEDDRQSRGFPRKHPILKRTGKLRNSIKITPNLKSMNWSIDSVDYGEHLHEGRSNMKKRRILDLPMEWNIGGKEESLLFSQVNNNLETRGLKIIQELHDKIDKL